MNREDREDRDVLAVKAGSNRDSHGENEATEGRMNGEDATGA